MVSCNNNNSENGSVENARLGAVPVPLRTSSCRVGPDNAINVGRSSNLWIMIAGIATSSAQPVRLDPFETIHFPQSAEDDERPGLLALELNRRSGQGKHHQSFNDSDDEYDSEDFGHATASDGLGGIGYFQFSLSPPRTPTRPTSYAEAVTLHGMRTRHVETSRPNNLTAPPPSGPLNSHPISGPSTPSRWPNSGLRYSIEELQPALDPGNMSQSSFPPLGSTPAPSNSSTSITEKITSLLRQNKRKLPPPSRSEHLSQLSFEGNESSPSLATPSIPSWKRLAFRRRQGNENSRPTSDSSDLSQVSSRGRGSMSALTSSWHSADHNTDLFGEKQGAPVICEHHITLPSPLSLDLPLDSPLFHPLALKIITEDAQEGDIWRFLYKPEFSQLFNFETDLPALKILARKLGITSKALGHFFIITKITASKHVSNGANRLFQCVTLTTWDPTKKKLDDQIPVLFCKEDDCPGMTITQGFCRDGKWRLHCEDKPWQSRAEDLDTYIYKSGFPSTGDRFATYEPDIEVVAPAEGRVAKVTDSTLKWVRENAAPVHRPRNYSA